jgi:septum formation protein
MTGRCTVPLATASCETPGVPHLILASSSPRRRLLLAAAGYVFDVALPEVEEFAHPGEGPERMVVRLARAKALAVRAGPDDVVLAADTTVVLDGEMLGKPADEADAVEMLLSISGRTHVVLTGWATVADGTVLEDGLESSLVSVRPIEREEAVAYAASGEPLDKAGGYALQGRAGAFVTGVAGPRSNVIGLPLSTIVGALGRAGIVPSP